MSRKYAIIVNEETKAVDVGVGTDIKYYQSLGMTEMEVEQGYNGTWYLKGYAPQKPEPSALEQIKSLEAQITERNIRSALLGDQFALDKIREIESVIEDLREKLPLESNE